MSAAEILHHIAAFLSETLTDLDLRRQLSSTFVKILPANHKFALQTLEKAISTTSPSVRYSSLRLSEKLLLSNATTPFSSFLISLVHHLSHRPIHASLALLDVFQANPSFSRLEMAPSLFQELFLVHLTPFLEWHEEQRCKILSSSSSGDSGDEVSMTRTVLSKMSGDQALALKDLERDFEVLLDDNCRILAEYFKEVLINKDGDETIVPPKLVLLHNTVCDDKGLYDGDEESIETQVFCPTNRRYNPIWVEGDRSDELNMSKRGKSLSKFPSFFPVRVSPTHFTNQTSSKQLETSPNNDFSPISNDNSTGYSSSDYQTQLKENIKKVPLFDSKKSHPQKKKKPISLYPITSPPHPLMEDVNGGEKHTPPKDFVCPITTHVFDDPVTLETGQTYERKAIQEWLERGNSTCPITRHKLHSTQLPKTNYVLKRLIATWQEQNTVIQAVDEPTVGAVSPKSVISQATSDGAMTELRLAITELCTSQVLREAEMAVIKIQRLWKDADMEQEMQSMLAKPPVINGFVEILINSVDTQVLKATIVLLTALGSRDDCVVQTLTRVDSDVECIVQLFKKGLSEAVVLVNLLSPKAATLVEMNIEESLVELLITKEYDRMAKTATVLLLARVLNSAIEARDIVTGLVSSGAVEEVIVSLKSEGVEERMAAVRILLRCIVEDGKCRNIIAEKGEVAPLVEILLLVNHGDRFQIIHFLSELVKLNRRNLNEQILRVLKDEGSFSIMHTLLICLQNAPLDHAPLVAGLLLQLDLLDEPRKMSIYREEAMDTLISCLKNLESPLAQISAAETILSLQGRFSYSGKSLSRAILLKRAGLDRSYRAFMRKDQRHHNISSDALDTMESAEEWEKKVAFVVVSHEFGLIFEALGEGLKSNYEELQSVCFMTATWLIYMLSILPDTGLRGASRVCLLNHFIFVFKSDNDTEDRALSMLGLNTFIRDSEGFQDLSGDMKEILKGLRKLKKSSTMAFEMLKVFSEEHDNSADIWSHKELSQEDCAINGEVLTISFFKGKIFSGHSDGRIKVWTTEGRELHLIQEVHDHTKAVTSLAALHASEKLYSGSLDRTVRAWTVTEEGICCEQVEEMKDQINNLVVANSMACYIPQGAGIRVHSRNGSSKLVNQNKHAKCLALVQGKLYCGCNDNSIQEIDLATLTLGNIQTGSKKLLGKAYPVYALQVDDGLLYAAGGPSFDGPNVKIRNSSNYSLIGSVASTLDVRTMAVSSELIYLGGKSGNIEVWCKKKHSRVETLQTSSTAKILCMALDTNEDMLVVGTSDGKIQTWGLS